MTGTCCAHDVHRIMTDLMVSIRYDEWGHASLSYINMYDEHTMCRNRGRNCAFVPNIVPVYGQL